MNTLTIDIGNNKIKLDYWADEGIITHSVEETLSLEDVKRKVESYDIKGIILSSVRKNYEDIFLNLKDNCNCIIVDFDSREIERHSKKIRYNGMVGADRIAAFLGAKALKSGPKLIIDAGTAITLDIEDKDGNYCGGNISLGFRTRLNALAQATSLLPKVEKFECSSFFGSDTLSAIQDGARNGVTGEMLYTLDLARQEYQIEWVVMTGGDSKRFFQSLSNKWEKSLYDDFLVGRGLNYHLRKFYFPEAFQHTNFQQSI
ncbi:MAG: type III pantothenate kinase [Muribaculaceae bacterium]|nr:type III pantothenate kinase [Muribaculaceae bacterium]